MIITPNGNSPAPVKPDRNETMIRALVKAHRWRWRIENGKAKSITDLAAEEDVTDAYVCRLLRLTCLAPDIVEAILDGQQPEGRRLTTLIRLSPVNWKEQRCLWA